MQKITHELIEQWAKEMADQLATQKPEKPLGLLIEGQGNFETYHGCTRSKFWDASGYKKIDLKEAIRIIMGYCQHLDVNTLKGTWCPTPPEGYLATTRYGRREIDPSLRKWPANPPVTHTAPHRPNGLDQPEH